MAQTFSKYAQKFAEDRYKQVQALVKAGDAFYKLDKFETAHRNFTDAISIFEKFKKGLRVIR